MAVAAIDSGVIIALANADDEHHASGTAIVRGMDRGDLPVGRVIDYVALEALNWIHNRRRHQKAVETQRRLAESAGFEIHQSTQADYTRAVELFETYEGLAFGDATIVAYMQRTGVEHLYSFDDDFDALDGITRLDSATNPF